MKDKQWYVDQHRAMWHWIADQIEVHKKVCHIGMLKKDYLDLVLKFSEWEYPSFGCFACEYACNNSCDIRCVDRCLFHWSDDKKFVRCDDESGFYRRLREASTWQEQAALARKIANLPVREDV